MTYKRLLVEWGIVFVLMAISFVRRKKIRVLPSLILTIFVTFFALLSPVGKVLTTISSFRITEGALYIGLHKSAVLVGMVFLSQTIVSYKIQFPGRLGIFVNEVFFLFNQLTSQRISFQKGHIISQIDEALLRVWQRQTNER